MKRSLLFLVVLALAVGTNLLAQGRGGMSGRQGGGRSTMSGPQHGGEARGQAQQPSWPQRDQQQMRQQSRLHDCQQAWSKTPEQAQKLERYTKQKSFGAGQAREMGAELGDQLWVMDQEHLRLRDRLSPAEQERERRRLQTLDGCQQRWQQAYGALDQELTKDPLHPEQLRRQARTIEKEVNRYRKEVQRLEEVLAQ